MNKNRRFLKKVCTCGLAVALAMSTANAGPVVTFAAETNATYKFGLFSDGHGSLKYGSEEGDAFREEGTYDFTVTPDDGYKFVKLVLTTDEGSESDVTGDTGLGEEGGSFSWYVCYAGSLKAYFEEKEPEQPEEPEQPTKRSVKLTSDGNGQITLDGRDGDLGDLEDGKTYRFTITAYEGYELDKVIEASAGDVTQYVKDGVLEYQVSWADLEFKAYFKQVEEADLRRHVKLTSDGNGQITLDGRDGDLVDLEDGKTYQFTITANEGYELDKVIETSAGDVTQYVKDGVLEYQVSWADLEFKAYFKQAEEVDLRRHVKLTSDGNGQITLDGRDGDLVDLEDGKTYRFVITANEGYELDKVIEASAGDVTQYVKDGVMEYMIPWADLEFKATFKKTAVVAEGYRWNLSSDGNGVISCEELGYDGGDKFVKEGTYTFKVKANEGYVLDKIYNQDNVDVTADAKVAADGTFEWRVAYDGGLRATFKKAGTSAGNTGSTGNHEDNKGGGHSDSAENTESSSTETSAPAVNQSSSNDAAAQQAAQQALAAQQAALAQQQLIEQQQAALAQQQAAEQQTPKTGDEMPVGAAAGGSLAALAAIAAMILRKKRILF